MKIWIPVIAVGAVTVAAVVCMVRLRSDPASSREEPVAFPESAARGTDMQPHRAAGSTLASESEPAPAPAATSSTRDAEATQARHAYGAPLVVDRSAPAAERIHVYERLSAAQVREKWDDLIAAMADRNEFLPLRNELANTLRKAEDPRLVAELRRMLADEKEPSQWRGYCVQQLYACYESGIDETVPTTLFEATSSPVVDVQSTAIWSLALAATTRGVAQLPEEEIARLKDLTLAALRDDGSPERVRITGVQASDRLGLTDALPDIRRIAADTDAPAGLRIPAVAALGSLGDETDLELIRALESGSGVRLRTVAKQARERIASAADPAARRPVHLRPAP